MKHLSLLKCAYLVCVFSPLLLCYTHHLRHERWQEITDGNVDNIALTHNYPRGTGLSCQFLCFFCSFQQIIYINFFLLRYLICRQASKLALADTRVTVPMMSNTHWIHKMCTYIQQYDNGPLKVAFGWSSVVLLLQRSHFHARLRWCLLANVAFPGPLSGFLSRNGLKKRRNSVKYPSIHPRQIRENCRWFFCAGQVSLSIYRHTHTNNTV